MIESAATRVIHVRQGASGGFREALWPWLMLALGVGLLLLVAGLAMRAPERHLAPDSFGYLTRL